VGAVRFDPVDGGDGARPWGMSRTGVPLQVIDESDLTNDDLVMWSESSDSFDRISPSTKPQHRGPAGCGRLTQLEEVERA
jgi:hypothetical protein